MSMSTSQAETRPPGTTDVDSSISTCGPGELRRSLLMPVIRALAGIARTRRRALSLALRQEGGGFYSGTARELMSRWYGVEIGAYSYGECFVPGAFQQPARIGRYVSVAAGVRAFGRNHPVDWLSTHPFFFNRHLGLIEEDAVPTALLTVGSDAWIGQNAVITAGCRRIGLGAVIGAGSVVTHDVPDFAVVAGVPAKVLRYRFPPDVQGAIRASRWWERPIDDLAGHLDAMTLPIPSPACSHPLLR
jgi:virginiamycin A acetyltransferase